MIETDEEHQIADYSQVPESHCILDDQENSSEDEKHVKNLKGGKKNFLGNLAAGLVKTTSKQQHRKAKKLM